MNAERWPSVKRLLQSALERPPTERELYLRRECAGNEALRSEVESLLTAYDQAGSLLDSEPASTSEEELKPGTILGSYEIISLIGSGGMGRVYRACDMRLGREVAVKVLRADFADDLQRKLRFDREAKMISRLNHPHICTLHDVGEATLSTAGGGSTVQYLVMEFVDGETLARRIERRPLLSIEEVLRLGSEIATALDTAHRSGITHRDLKPANVMLTRTGLKLLDFGLATPAVSAEHDETTLQKPVTEEGTIVGTLQYMAPEQLEGKHADARSDIFALGVTLFEMVTGKKPFEGASKAGLIAAVLERDPPSLRSLRPIAPETLEHVIRRCLEKDPDERWQNAHDVARELAWIAKPEQPARAWLRLRWVVPAVGLVVFLGTIGYVAMRPRAPTAEKGTIRSVAVLPFENSQLDADTEYMRDGLTEGLINDLSRIPNLRVLARTTSFTYKNKRIDPRQIGRDLGVDAVVMGKLALHNEDLIVQAELVNVETLSQLWGDRFEEHSRDLGTIEQAIALRVSRKLRPDLTIQQQRQLAAAHTTIPEAYELYLRGRFEFNKRNAEAVQRAIEFFRRAIEVDPRFALAYCGLSDSYRVATQYEMVGLGRDQAQRKAEVATARALELAPDLPEVHASYGGLLSRRWAWREAEREFRTAIALNPNYASAHLWLALTLDPRGRYDEAIRELRRAENVDPLAPIIFTDLSYLLARAGRYPEAFADARRALELNPDFGWAYSQLGFAYCALGKYEDAIAAFEKLRTIPGYRYNGEAGLAWAYGRSGRTSEALKMAREVEDAVSRGSAYPTLAAVAYVGLRNDEKVLTWLNKGIDERDPVPQYYPSVAFAHLRSDPRYQDILRRLAAGSNDEAL